MLNCLIPLIFWVIIALIVLVAVEAILDQFLKLPPAVYMLLRLLIGLIILVNLLNCLALFDGGRFGALNLWPRCR